MKMFVILVLTVTALFVWQRSNQEKTGKDQLAPTARVSAISEHDWARHSLDRAHEVAGQVVRVRQENDQP
jgi:hypothetical protein